VLQVREAWKEAVGLLKKAGVISPSREARLLLSSVLRTDPSRVHLFWDFGLEEEKLKKLHALLKERARGVPIQYLIGEWEFMSLPFYVEEGVFIPRLDTECWVEEVILFLKKASTRELLLCDVGCGSGIIGLSCAFWVPQVKLYGVDISERAIALSKKNARRLGIEDRCRFLRSDLFEVFKGQNILFDTVVSNPPYVKTGDWELLPKEIRFYEPREALLAGEDGLSIIRRLLLEGASFIKKGGLLFFEHDPAQSDFIRKEIEKLETWEYLYTIKDYAHKDRATVVKRKE